jgi:hypothetical protein
LIFWLQFDTIYLRDFQLRFSLIELSFQKFQIDFYMISVSLSNSPSVSYIVFFI